MVENESKIHNFCFSWSEFFGSGKSKIVLALMARFFCCFIYLYISIQQLSFYSLDSPAFLLKLCFILFFFIKISQNRIFVSLSTFFQPIQNNSTSINYVCYEQNNRNSVFTDNLKHNNQKPSQRFTCFLHFHHKKTKKFLFSRSFKAFIIHVVQTCICILRQWWHCCHCSTFCTNKCFCFV